MRPWQVSALWSRAEALRLTMVKGGPLAQPSPIETLTALRYTLCNTKMERIAMAQSTVGIRLDDDTQERLKALGKQRDRSPHYLMKAAIEAYLDQEEALEAEKALLQERWAQFELTGETIPQSDMKSWAASLGSKKA